MAEVVTEYTVQRRLPGAQGWAYLPYVFATSDEAEAYIVRKGPGKRQSFRIRSQTREGNTTIAEFTFGA